MKITQVTPWKWGGLRPKRLEGFQPSTLRRQMDSLHEEMDRLFDSLAELRDERMFWPKLVGRDELLPDIDETEDDKAIHISIELPGMDEKDVDVTLTGRELTIRGEKKQEEELREKDYFLRERTYGSFRRTLELPVDIDESAIEASFRKGVLSLTLPKTAEAQQKIKHIEIKAA